MTRPLTDDPGADQPASAHPASAHPAHPVTVPAPEGRPLSRRHVLAAAGAVGAAGVLAACSSGSSDAGATSAAATSSAAETSAAPESSSAQPTETSGGGGGEAIAATADVPVEGGVIVESPAPIVVTQPASGDFKAFTAICPHQGCTVNEVAANEIICPCHGSKFSASDGAVLQGPATTGLAPVDVAVDGSNVVLT
ncbi:MAG: Rieske (2Fe-2S) protein [Candidatus Nanopelagicales bacterium]